MTCKLSNKKEEYIHMEVVRALRSQDNIRFWHTPNASKASIGYRKKLKALGLSAGVPDLTIVTPPPIGGYIGAALELKSDKGAISPEQVKWLEDLKSLGWATACTKGLRKSLIQLIEWGYLPENFPLGLD